MVRLTIMAPLDAEFFGGTADMEVEAATLFDLVRALGRISPGFVQVAEVRGAFAVGGEVAADWTAPLPRDAQVLLLPRIGGG